MLEVEGPADSRARGRAGTFLEALEVAAEHAADLVVLLDRDGLLRYANPSAALTFGVALSDAIGTSAASYLHPEDVARATERFVGLLRRPGESMTDTVRFVSTTNEVRILEIVCTNRLHDPEVGGVLVNGRDVTERRHLETELLEQSLHDALTGLPNRTLFVDRAERLLALAHRDRLEVAVLFVDLDNFKTFNDGMGHHAGDALLVAVARRMQGAIRGEDLLCRFGGDEFVVLADPRSGSMTAPALAERLIEELREPFEISGRVLSVTASIGIATGRDLGVEELVRDADLAMYEAKARGKNQAVAFDAQMIENANERLQLVLDLQRALDTNEFVVHFQPIIELEDDRVAGVEALVRWQHPVKGLLAPAEFIELAEENGMIVELGRLVLANACARAVEWDFAAREMCLSVNLSARQLACDGLVDDVAGILARTGLPASALVLEITESTIMQDAEAAIARLCALKELGVRLAIDDFGTGYSSLSHLRRIPVDVLKIDRTFVADLHASTEAAAIVRSLIELGRTLELDLVAEGVELVDQLDELRRHRCHKAQGFLFARPLDGVQLAELLEAADGALRLPAGAELA